MRMKRPVLHTVADVFTQRDRCSQRGQIAKIFTLPCFLRSSKHGIDRDSSLVYLFSEASWILCWNLHLDFIHRRIDCFWLLPWLQSQQSMGAYKYYLWGYLVWITHIWSHVWWLNQWRAGRRIMLEACQRKALIKTNRQELHAAISCHAFCSPACLYPLFCSSSRQQHQLNTAQCSTSCGKCARLNCPCHTHTHRVALSLMHIQMHFHTYAQLLWSFPGSMTWLPIPCKPHCFLDTGAESHCRILTFSTTKLIKHSLCSAGEPIAVNVLITDSEVGVVRPAER